MTHQKSIASLVKENKTVFIIIAVVLFLIELEIFAVAAMKSGRQAWLQIVDEAGTVVYETDGKNLSDFNKYYFEKTFGPLNEYEKRLKTVDVPFNFRAWFTAAVGIPVGVILLFAFVVKAYVSLFYGDTQKSPPGKGGETTTYDTEFEKIIAVVSGFNIFTIGFLVLLAVFMYWVLPNMVSYIGKVSVDTLIRFKWVFIAAGVVLVGLFAWVIYLRYLLAKRNIDNQAELERVRLQLEYHRDRPIAGRLPHLADSAETPQLTTTWEEEVPEKPTGTPSEPSPETSGS